MRRSKAASCGFCTAGNHRYCPGEIERPGGAEPWRCACGCVEAAK